MDNYQRYYAIFETKLGWIGLSGSDAGISRATLPQTSKGLAYREVGNEADSSLCSNLYFEQIIEELLNYFRGQRVEFAEKLDIANYSPFEQTVWEATRKIQYGQTKSYAEISRQIGKPFAHRAVGHALGKNPLAIVVPCHRVIASDGKLGGFSGGLTMKRYLLDMEAANQPCYV